MKKRTCCLLLIFAGILFLGAVSAAGGDAGDPLISLSFLKNTFSSGIDRSVDGALEQSDQALLNDANTQWNKILAVAEHRRISGKQAEAKRHSLRSDRSSGHRPCRQREDGVLLRLGRGCDRRC